jgi:phosphatidylserine/phosphatidylglycerophosphate/cardiolipin synthase-like enzyme
LSPGPIPSLRSLSTRTLVDLAQALRTGRLTEAATAFMIRHQIPAVGEAAAIELSSLLCSGLCLQHAGLLLDAIAAEQNPRADAAVIELVTSGPDIAGATRDTGVVLRELFAEAEHRVLVIGFAVHQGREIFATLADRMSQRPDLAARLCLDIRRAPGDTAKPTALLRRFAERFIRYDWPGPRLPDLFFDPRGLAEGESRRASLHAKCVVVDGVRSLIGSANLTEAAHHRNIEIGVVVTGAIAEAAERHVDALIIAGHLQRLLLER